ncbi:MAG: hypothetical protein JWR07_1465 [Nevskia sp.]|nr:hypothetical protein [Nevskia sp.]
MRLLSAERVDLERKGLFSGTIATVFKHFRESRMSTFDDKLDGLEWEIDEERVAYVRGHRDAFETMT